MGVVTSVTMCCNLPVGSALADAYAGPLFSKPGSDHATLERVRQGGPYENTAFIVRGQRLRMTSSRILKPEALSAAFLR
jgi:hypothetical protein